MMGERVWVPSVIYYLQREPFRIHPSNSSWMLFGQIHSAVFYMCTVWRSLFSTCIQFDVHYFLLVYSLTFTIFYLCTVWRSLFSTCVQFDVHYFLLVYSLTFTIFYLYTVWRSLFSTCVTVWRSHLYKWVYVMWSVEWWKGKPLFLS